MNNVEKIKKLYREGFKQVVDSSRLDKMINEANGIEKQRLQEFKWFIQCADIDKADIMGLIMLNKSYQFWQSIFIYILTESSREENNTDEETEDDDSEEAEERSANRTLSDDEIEILAPNERCRIEDFDDEDEDYEDEEEE